MINTNCMTTNYHSNQLNRKERVLQTMVKYDPELYKESLGNSLSPGIFIGKAPLNRIKYLDNLF